MMTPDSEEVEVTTSSFGKEAMEADKEW